MTSMLTTQYRPDSVSPPGDSLLDTLEAIGMSQAELSERSGLAQKTVNHIMSGKAPITEGTALLLERVLGIAYKGKAEGFEYLLQRIIEINQRQGTNYQVDSLRVNAANYGVPQVRERMLLVGHRDGLALGSLDATHAWHRNEKKQSDFIDDGFLEPFLHL